MSHPASAATGRRVRIAAFAVLLTAGALIAAPGAVPRAAAGAVDEECALGGFSRTFDPGVTETSTTQTVATTYTYGSCEVGSAGTGTDVETAALACLDVTQGTAETETVTWADDPGDPSTIAYGAPTLVGQTTVYTGTVTAGLYEGDTAVKITDGVSYFGSALQCLLYGTPITATTGIVTSLTLTSA